MATCGSSKPKLGFRPSYALLTMKVKLLKDVNVRAGLSYRKGQHVHTTWIDDRGVLLGGSRNGVTIEYGVDFVPIWDEHFLRERMNIKCPTVKEKS